MYATFISMLFGPGRKLSLEMCLGIVLNTLTAQGPKEEPGERHPLMVPSSMLEFGLWKSRCAFSPNSKPSSKLRTFFFLLKKKKNLYCEEDLGIISGFQFYVYMALKFLLPPMWWDLYVSVIPNGNINSENRFCSLWQQLLSWKWRQLWMKYKWGTEQGREEELHLTTLSLAAVWPTEVRVGWGKKLHCSC